MTYEEGVGFNKFALLPTLFQICELKQVEHYCSVFFFILHFFFSFSYFFIYDLYGLNKTKQKKVVFLI